MWLWRPPDASSIIYEAAAASGICRGSNSWSASPVICCLGDLLIVRQVLDEADRLLTSTFSADMAHIFSVLPKDRQTALFTATWTPSIETIADAPPRPGKQKPFVHRMVASYA